MAVVLTVRGFHPVIADNCFVAENATIVGEVKMGNRCSVWFNAVIRGDVNSIEIGDDTNLQDGCIVHGTYKLFKTVIGSRVSIGHNAVVHGCAIKDDVLIGMGAIVMDGVIVEENCVIAAGSVVLAGTHIKAGSVYAGVPAKR